MAEFATAIRVGKRHDNDVADLHLADRIANGLDDTDGFMAHTLSGLAEFHRSIGPEIAAADAGMGNADKRVGWIDESGIGDVLNPDVSGAVHNSCSHVDTSGFRLVVYSALNGEWYCSSVTVSSQSTTLPSSAS
jgi:hypothetical protein